MLDAQKYLSLKKHSRRCYCVQNHKDTPATACCAGLLLSPPRQETHSLLGPTSLLSKPSLANLFTKLRSCLSSAKERVGLAREKASQCPDGGIQGRKDKGLSPALAGEKDAGIWATQREWGHLTRPQLPSTQCFHAPHSPAPPGLPQVPTTQCFLSKGAGDSRLLWALRACILQILAQNPREET